MRYILAIIFTFSLFGCSSVKSIDESEMESIIKEALLTGSIKNSDKGVIDILEREDSVDVYLLILTRRGYTLTDFEHTVQQMSSRKSNPLGAILERIVVQIDAMALAAEKRYRVARRFDSLALAAYTDTIYKCDTIIRGSLAKFKIIPDTTVAAGDYSIRFTYRSVDNYRVGSKSIVYKSGDTLTTKKMEKGTIWFTRQSSETPFTNNFTLKTSHDTLRFTFIEPKLDASLAKTFKDSSYIKDIRLVYTPVLEQARQQYYRQYFGPNNSLFRNYETKKDSLPLRIGPWL